MHHSARRKPSPGFPEALALLLVSASIVFAVLWWTNRQEIEWAVAEGTVVDSDIRYVHRNAENDLLKVSVTYEYTVGGMPRRGYWAGHWPSTNSPNALPEQDVKLLEQPDYPLAVLYDPNAVSESRIHYTPGGVDVIYAALAVVTSVCAVLYLARVYPRWRQM